MPLETATNLAQLAAGFTLLLAVGSNLLPFCPTTPTLPLRLVIP